MKLLFDFLPIAVFFGVYQVADIYWATALAIGTALVQVIGLALARKPVSRTHWLNVGLLAALGGLTLILRNDAFIMWKPSLVNWLFAALFLGSLMVGKRSLAERLMGEQIQLPRQVWTRLTLAWVAFFVTVGLLNAYVAFGYRVAPGSLDADEQVVYQNLTQDAVYADAVLGSALASLEPARQTEISALPAEQRRADYLDKLHRDLWVDFKLFGLLGLTLVFALAQGFYLVRHIDPDASPATGAAK